MSDAGTGAPRIAIVGGGFAGLNAALKLVDMPWPGAQRPSITLIERGERHVFLPMLYDLVTGDVSEWEVAPRLDELLAGTGVQLLRANLEGIDASARELRLSGVADAPALASEELPYDRLVLAIGAQPAPPPSAGGLAFRSLEDALALRARLRALKSSAAPLIRVLVVGTSYSGIELAASIARDLGVRRGLVSLVGRGPTLLPDGSAASRELAQRALEDAGVEVLLGRSVALESERVATLTPAEASPSAHAAHAHSRADRTAQDASGAAAPPDAAADATPAAPPPPPAAESMEADLVIWCTGSVPRSPAAELGLAAAADGRVATRASLEAEGADGIYCIGDMALCQPLAGTPAAERTAQLAVQQSDYAAYNVWASLTDRAPLPFRYAKLGEMLTYGPTDASVDAAGLLSIGGLPGAALRRAAYLYRMPTNSHRARVGFSWALDAAVRSADALLNARSPRAD